MKQTRNNNTAQKLLPSSRVTLSAMLLCLCMNIKNFTKKAEKQAQTNENPNPYFFGRNNANSVHSKAKIQLFTQGNPQAFTRTRADYGKHGRRMFYFGKIKFMVILMDLKGN